MYIQTILLVDKHYGNIRRKTCLMCFSSYFVFTHKFDAVSNCLQQTSNQFVPLIFFSIATVQIVQ